MLRVLDLPSGLGYWPPRSPVRRNTWLRGEWATDGTGPQRPSAERVGTAHGQECLAVGQASPLLSLVVAGKELAPSSGGYDAAKQQLV